jgi:hypothetical protein
MKTLAVSLAILMLVSGGVQAAQPVGGVQAARPIEVPLKFVKASGFGGQQRAKISLTPPPGRFKMPKFKAAKPLYMTIRLGDSHYLAVADFSSSESHWYDCLYVDGNRNGDLTDDKVIKTKPTTNVPGGSVKVSAFGIVGVTVGRGNKSAPYFFTSRLYGSSLKSLETTTRGPASISFAITSACHYTGTLRVNDVDCQLLLADSNCNGTFHDLPAPNRISADRSGMMYNAGDLLYLCDRARVGHRDGAMLCSRIAFGSDLYQVEIDTAAKLLKLKPARETVGYLTIPFQAQNIVLRGERIPFVGFMVQNKIPVPVGKYRLSSYVYAKQHGREHWRLSAMFLSSSAKPVVVTARNTTPLKLGEAYGAIADVRKKKSLEIWVKPTLGVGGEMARYVERGITRDNPNGRIVNPPTYEIFANGRKVGGGRFKYG